MKKIIFSLALLTGISGKALANTTPKKNPGVPGNDSAAPAKEIQGKTYQVPPKNSVPVLQKTKIIPIIVAPEKKETSYEVKAPSIFTFTVLNTYLNMPIQKK